MTCARALISRSDGQVSTQVRAASPWGCVYRRCCRGWRSFRGAGARGRKSRRMGLLSRRFSCLFSGQRTHYLSHRTIESTILLNIAGKSEDNITRTFCILSRRKRSSYIWHPSPCACGSSRTRGRVRQRATATIRCPSGRAHCSLIGSRMLASNGKASRASAHLRGAMKVSGQKSTRHVLLPADLELAQNCGSQAERDRSVIVASADASCEASAN